MKIFETFRNFGVIFGSFWGPWGQQKSPGISSITNRTKPNLCVLDSMGNTLKVEYKFGAWQIL